MNSWLTGRRLVSLPFSDHCEPLADPGSLSELLSNIQRRIRESGWKYAELRPLTSSQLAAGFQPSASFHLHSLSLEPSADTLFRNLHKNCIQRKVRRAEREGLIYEKGRSATQLSKFYQLLLRTRRRQLLPPQPIEWFRNLIDCFGEALTIRVMSRNDIPVAAMITLSLGNTVTYKYGCSDERFNALGGMPALFWKAILESQQQSMLKLDLGRSDLDNEGLAVFKDRIGAVRTRLDYFRCWSRQPLSAMRPAWVTRMANQVFACMPNVALTASGKFLYRHIG